MQSPPTEQPRPLPQAGQLPPQSVPVSEPFIVWSLQVGAGVAQVPLEQ